MMVTHMLILKCPVRDFAQASEVENFLMEELDHPQVFYFGRDGKRVTGYTKKFFRRVKNTLYVKVSFHHLLKLDPVHAFAVIKEALREGFVTKFTYNQNELVVTLH